MPDVYRIAVRRIPDGGGGSIEVHDVLEVGATATTQGPRNAFPLTVPGYGSPTRRFRFIAGGIGITPILPMLALAQRLGVDWSMVYAGRTRDSLPFLDEVAVFGDRVRIHTDDDGRAAVGVRSARRLSGRHRGLCVRSRPDADRHPVGIGRPRQGRTSLRAVRRAARRGRQGVRRHGRVDRTTDPRRRRRDPARGAEPAGCARAVLVSAGLLRDVPDAGARYGDVDHRDTLLTDPEHENQMMLICISRAAEGSRLTLDL